MEPCTSQPKPKKTKNIHLKKKSLYFGKRNFLALILKESFSSIFSNETLHFSLPAHKIKEINPRKISYTSRNENPKKPSYKLLLRLRKQNPRNRNSKKASYISGGNLQSPKNKQKSLLWRNFLSLMTFLQFLDQ